MKMFLFEDLDEVSPNYHCNGGLVVVARDKDHVKELIAEERV
ncbi:hypothetical protein [Alkalihalobacillus trypoxylicola]|nr:hypothetical protein [Alkalihalobacillus trypoxylicola]